MKTPKSDARDPRFRPYRIAMYALYLAAVGFISILIIISVVRSVIAMSPGRREESLQSLTVRECLDQARSLWTQLDAQREKLTNQPKARDADEAWLRFRVKWLERKRELESKCGLRSKERERLRDAFGQLERAMDLYTVHATQYAGEIGQVVDGLRESLEEAEGDLGAKRR